MKIPRDLKPGDRLWYSDTEFATVGWDGDSYDEDLRTGKPWIWAAQHNGHWAAYFVETGYEVDNYTPPIIRIERIASKPTKRAKVDKDAAWLLKLETTPGYIRRRLRAIARRLNNGDEP